MNEKVLHVLEYEKILEQLAENASSTGGKELCKNLTPLSDIDEINRKQSETADAVSRIFAKGSVSFSGVRNILGSMRHLEVGGTLSIEELLQIAALLEVTNRIKTFGRRDREIPGSRQNTENAADSDFRDSLSDLFDGLEPITPLSSEIRRCILSEDEIADDASSTLKQLRRNMKLLNDRIHSQLSSMVNGSLRTYLQDAVITMRNDRYCIPVKAEYKGQVPGMIHDQSSTGSTLFIEPSAIVKLNNDLKELQLKEEQEILVILARLSSEAGDYREAITYNYKILSELDFIFARAKLAIAQNATIPVYNENGIIHIRGGRHPLLDKKSVVPIDIRLGDDFDLLIVTGPNTGGKTVSLKTVGLLSLMGQSGLHIPAKDRSELSVFTEIYADIGDEQSIEQSLSTFSSHMKNIVHILKHADTKSLCLFDELGAGTDPTEGAALAIAVLSHLHEQGIRAMATTHYSELKVYALSTEGVENACCEFDVETLRPTYRLLIGVPGKSNAFAISSKLGLPDFIIEKAKKNISESDESFEDLLANLEQSRITIEKEQLEIKEYKKEIEDLKEQLQKKQTKIEESREKILASAREEARSILQEAKDTADETIRHFQKYGDINAIREMEKDRTKLREKIGKNSQQTKKAAEKDRTYIDPKKLKLGDSVKVLTMNVKGTVHSLPDAKGNLFVQCGILRTQVNFKDLVLIDEEVISAPSIKRTGSGKVKLQKTSSISVEINLIGKTVDEAIAALDKYLDDAYLSHLPSVRVVHGKGTGALRNAVHNHLKRVKYVKEYHLAAFGEGDAGVTIVTFQ